MRGVQRQGGACRSVVKRSLLTEMSPCQPQPYILKGDQVRAILREGPTTSKELADTLGWQFPRAAAWMTELKRRGETEIVGNVGTGRRRAYIYALK